jgi:hypothetical protein
VRLLAFLPIAYEPWNAAGASAGETGVGVAGTKLAAEGMAGMVGCDAATAAEASAAGAWLESGAPAG